jgi:hypothetical protein
MCFQKEEPILDVHEAVPQWDVNLVAARDYMLSVADYIWDAMPAFLSRLPPAVTGGIEYPVTSEVTVGIEYPTQLIEASDRAKLGLVTASSVCRGVSRYAHFLIRRLTG